jgi:hypothetical protein
MAFRRTDQESVFVWRGDPDCAAAQDFVRKWLRENVSPYPVGWVPGNTQLQGSLGECIAFCCAIDSWDTQPRCFAANAFNPFSGISRNEIDLLWIFFAEDPSDDVVIQQEVKTTLGMDLAYARRLLDDYKKSFGANPRCTLNTNLQAAKSRLKYEVHAPDLARRINALQAGSAKAAKHLIAIPTLIHDTASEDSVPKMAGIEAELRAEGWQEVQAWAVGLSTLPIRLENITKDTA